MEKVSHTDQDSSWYTEGSHDHYGPPSDIFLIQFSQPLFPSSLIPPSYKFPANLLASCLTQPPSFPLFLRPPSFFTLISLPLCPSPDLFPHSPLSQYPAPLCPVLNSISFPVFPVSHILFLPSYLPHHYSFPQTPFPSPLLPCLPFFL